MNHEPKDGDLGSQAFCDPNQVLSEADLLKHAKCLGVQPMSYAETKARDDAWYEARAKFWTQNEHGALVECPIWKHRYDEPSDVWHGCYIPGKITAIALGPVGGSNQTLEVIGRMVKSLFGVKDVPNRENYFGLHGHQYRDIREAINAEGPWPEPGPTNESGAPGDAGAVGDTKGETVKPETVDAIVAMYEARIANEREQYDLAIHESHRLIHHQATMINDLTARMQRVRDALDGKPEKTSPGSNESPTDPVAHAISDVSHEQMAIDLATEGGIPCAYDRECGLHTLPPDMNSEDNF